MEEMQQDNGSPLAKPSRLVHPLLYSGDPWEKVAIQRSASGTGVWTATAQPARIFHYLMAQSARVDFRRQAGAGATAICPDGDTAFCQPSFKLRAEARLFAIIA